MTAVLPGPSAPTQEQVTAVLVDLRDHFASIGLESTDTAAALLDREIAMGWRHLPAPAAVGVCPGRVGDDADWCDTHGGTTAVCTVCDARVAVTSWATPFVDVSLWLIGAHSVEPVAASVTNP